jgi:hypothetical protein
MKIRKLLQDVLGGALGFVGMIVSLARGGKGSAKPKATSTEARGDGEKEKAGRKRGDREEKGKNVAIVRKKTAKKKATAKKAAPAKSVKKVAPVAPAKA